MASSSQPPPPPPPPAIPSQPPDIELAEMLPALVDPSAWPAGNIIIHDADVYAQDPADLTLQFAPAVAEDGQEAWYFSTKLLPKSQRGKRKKRCTDSGVWHDEGKSRPVVAVHGSETLVIAYRNLFAFVSKVDGKKEVRTGWIMHEFRLPNRNEESPVVLCKVFRSSRRCAEAQPVAAREAAVEAREAELAAWQARLAAREAELVRREAAVEAREAASSALQAELAAREASMPTSREFSRRVVWMTLAILWQMERREAAREALLRRDAAELAGEADLAAREAEREELLRRDAAHLAVLERNLNLQEERERNLAPWEETRLQALQEELEAELEALVLMIMMAAALLVARAGLRLLLPIAVEPLF